MLLNDVVMASGEVAATRSRKAKVAALAALLNASNEASLPVVVTWLGGAPRQRRTGWGWKSVATLPPPATEPGLTVLQVDALLQEASEVHGPGSVQRRQDLVVALFGAATGQEQEWLRALVVGELRQGALDSLVQEAVATVAGVPVAEVRRAAMMAGATPPVAEAALGAADPDRARAALATFTLTVGRPILPMLASSAPDVASALARTAGAGSAVIDTKLDGIRLQVHRRAGEVTVVTRSLDDITSRLPDVVRVVAALPGGDLVLDGEGLVVGAEGRPVPFQETASRTGRHDADSSTPESTVHPFFFDLLHRDGEDLLDLPLHERLAQLAVVVPVEHRTASVRTDDPDHAQAFTDRVLAAGHEGVVVKDPDSPYAAGRRGAAWVKVKPVHTLDLVVLAVEHGSGRRRGWLSNIHLGARDPETGELVMVGKTLQSTQSPIRFIPVGKTFKGMTDEMLRWQTERFLELETHREGNVVHVRPEQVVEIAFDGVQRSSKYGGGLVLRFARVVRYRSDKTANESDSFAAIEALLPEARHD